MFSFTVNGTSVTAEEAKAAGLYYPLVFRVVSFFLISALFIPKVPYFVNQEYSVWEVPVAITMFFMGIRPSWSAPAPGTHIPSIRITNPKSILQYIWKNLPSAINRQTGRVRYRFYLSDGVFLFCSLLHPFLSLAFKLRTLLRWEIWAAIVLRFVFNMYLPTLLLSTYVMGKYSTGRLDSLKKKTDSEDSQNNELQEISVGNF